MYYFVDHWLSFYFGSLYCLSFFDLRILNTHMAPSNISCKMHERLTLREHLGSPYILVGSVSLVFIVVLFLCLSSFCVLWSMLPVTLDCSFLVILSVFVEVYLINKWHWKTKFICKPKLYFYFFIWMENQLNTLLYSETYLFIILYVSTT